ncbi:MAG: exodeoxyribonuclease VII small subunit [Acidiferrobacteraceae bacterium]|nr:exodeoxyribonuclease VII small subunit [Acidiferrobacteraceae bacterium]
MSDFEKSLKELETIVERMEKGEQTLEASLKDFERGNTLAAACRVSLEEAEQRIEKLVERSGGLEREPLGNDD